MNKTIQSDPKFMFRTKAETLKDLKDKLALSYVPDFCFFPVEDWLTQKNNIIENATKRFKAKQVIVRSSACSEDMVFSAMAGVYDSIPHVDMSDIESFSGAVDKVIKSYKKHNTYNGNDYILVQLMIKDISMSGVLFTQDLNTGAPYYVINYDDESGRTDTITAGAENSNRTLLVHRASIDEFHSERFKMLLKAVKEIEVVTGSDSLDVEFALDKENKVHLFQVRPITTKHIWNSGIAEKVSNAIIEVKDFVSSSMSPKADVFGTKTIFGRMPDWNPAEMIGTAPRPLALSLYSYLITDSAWNKARTLMGYLELPGEHLMVSLSGQPYIDVRLSFNSFLPNTIKKEISEKLINAWINRLSANKHLHDKVEFNVAITALTFDFDQMIEEQMKDVLTKEENEAFRKSLFKLTNDLITQRRTPIKEELDKIEMLQKRREDFLREHKADDVNTVFHLLDDCIKLGTIPFSILARHAFISRSFLRALIRRKVLTEVDLALFLRSIKTIAGELVNDFDNLALGNITSYSFLSRYGHLRPGTYDILSQRYDQRQDLIDGNIKIANPRDPVEDFSFSDSQLRQMQDLLDEFGFEINPQMLIRYISDSMVAREYSKFIFTKNISEALEIIVSWGKSMGLSRDDLSYLAVQDILNNASKPDQARKDLEEMSRHNRHEHETTLALHLPYLIEVPEDVAIVPLFLNKPNFITKKKVEGQHVLLDGKGSTPINIEDQIVLIESADPGFDWIFSRRIKGLITKFGGANSHMAIRCAEFGIPAAIGCGEQIFDRVLRSREIELNCAEGRVIPIEG